MKRWRQSKEKGWDPKFHAQSWYVTPTCKDSYVLLVGKGVVRRYLKMCFSQPRDKSKQRIHEKSIYGKESCMVGFPRGASGKESTCQCRRCQRCRFDPWVGKTLWRGKGQPTPVFVPGKSHGQRSLVSYSPWGCKESDTTERLSTHAHTVTL